MASDGEIQDASGISTKQLRLKLQKLVETLLSTPDGKQNDELLSLSAKISDDDGAG